MSGRRRRSVRHARRRAAALLLPLSAALGAAALAHDGGSDARALPPPVPARIEPQLGPGLGAILLGSAPQGTSGDPAEAWAYRLVDRSLSPPIVDGAPLPFGAGEQQVVLLRWTSADGWRDVETPLTTSGVPYWGGVPRAGRVTPRGGLALATEDDALAGSASHRLLVRDRGDRLRAAPAPGDDVLEPASGSLPAERLSLDVLAATDAGDRTAAYVAIEGRTAQTGVAHWQDGAWTREPICLEDDRGAPPPGCAPGETLAGSSLSFQTVALAAAGVHAWLLARPAESTGLGLVLFERTGTGASVRWVRRPLGLPLLEAAATPARGVAAVAPLASSSALTATDDGVWVDGGLELRGVPESVTAFFDGSSSTTWCDGVDGGGAALCDHPLGARFGRFHRSFAWGGAGFGTRVISDAKRLDEAPDATAPEEYLTLDGTSFARHPTFNGALGRGAAFGAPGEGWVGWSHVTSAPGPAALAAWPLPARAPLSALASEPGHPAGDLSTGALAVGDGGTVLRYAPGQGWDSEPLLGASGIARPHLRGVAWPTDDFAYAVGDDGAMWRWTKVTRLWESDPGAPFDFVGQLMGIAFDPTDPDRGYAVGRAGVLLRYGKSWEQEQLPPEVAGTGPLGGPPDLTSVAFAGRQALVAAWTHLLVNDGDGADGGWHVDAGAQALLDQVDGARIYAVAGLPDGGAVAAGRGVVLIRDGAGAPWRFADQPLPDQIVSAVAAFREGDRVRALAAVTPGVASAWPLPEEYQLPPTEPGAPPPRLQALSPPTFGTLLRETSGGWRDEEQALFRTRGADHARKSDPLDAMLVDASGRGWVAGGWNGRGDALANGGDAPSSAVATAALDRYAPSGAEPPPAQRSEPIATPPGVARLLLGGHARCAEECDGLDQLALMPDRTLAQAVARASAWAAQPNGPSALLYVGGGAPQAGEASRLARLLAPATASLPVFAAVPTQDGASAAFAGFPGPLGGSGGAPATHYAADVATAAGTVRVIAIDNSGGSLAAGDPWQSPPEPQRPWLVQQLRDARARGVPAVVMGARSLNRFEPDQSLAASDADDVASLLRDEGASAYLYDASEAQRSASIPAGDPNGIPTFGSGTLGYRQPADADVGFGIPGLLMLELDTAGRDASTNRAPVRVRLEPMIEDLALEAVDGRVLNRSQPALFEGLGRRPRSGDRWTNGTGGSSPYVQLPNPSCARLGCAGRIDPEVTFTSSDPDIADFVRQDPRSTNPRKPFIDRATDKPVPDVSSGLLCAFNPGTTTVAVQAGGLAYSTTVTVLGGSVLRPCGTVPAAAAHRPSTGQAPAAASPPPPPLQQAQQPAAVAPVLPVVPPPAPKPAPERPQLPRPRPSQQRPARPAPLALLPAALLVPPSLAARPIPPSGTSPVSSPSSAMQPATKVEKQREEEEAFEHQQSAVRYMAGERRLYGGLTLVLVLGAALGLTALRSRVRPRGRGERLSLSYAPVQPRQHWRSR